MGRELLTLCKHLYYNIVHSVVGTVQVCHEMRALILPTSLTLKLFTPLEKYLKNTTLKGSTQHYFFFFFFCSVVKGYTQRDKAGVERR